MPTAQIEKCRADKYPAGSKYIINGKMCPPPWNSCMMYDGHLAVQRYSDVGYLKQQVTEDLFKRRVTPPGILDDVACSELASALHDAGRRKLRIFHCDGNEAVLMAKAGCPEGTAANLHAATRRALGLPYGGRAVLLPEGVSKFSMAENVAATLMLHPQIAKEKLVTPRMIQSVVSHTATGDIHTQIDAHSQIHRAATRRPQSGASSAPPPAKRRRHGIGASPSRVSAPEPPPLPEDEDFDFSIDSWEVVPMTREEAEDLLG